MPRLPGMDPYIEQQAWEDFHTSFVAALRAALVPQLRPNYIARVEVRIYVEQAGEQPVVALRPDVAVFGVPGSSRAHSPSIEAPALVALPVQDETREPFIEIRDSPSGRLVTVIELLSPSNKRRGSNGRHEYLAKRELLLRTDSHLLELDFLRAGDRLPMSGTLPPAEYYVILSRVSRRPLAEVWPIALDQRLPLVPVPLADEDADATVDLQQVFDTVFEQAGYDYGLNRSVALTPPLQPDQQTWMDEVLER